ncbi:MAG: rhodanese-like domain-containing protein [Chitinophagia bacterium]|nr:rhodanese-like domain-containing protein [Chitinophagia bacterium]
MLSFLQKIFGKGTSVNYAELIKNGAQIIDVRTPGEYQGGHIPGSKNIPLQLLSSKMGSLPKNQPIITCCASGMRSASAKSLLTKNGFPQVYNGGGWASLRNKI